MDLFRLPCSTTFCSYQDENDKRRKCCHEGSTLRDVYRDQKSARDFSQRDAIESATANAGCKPLAPVSDQVSLISRSTSCPSFTNCAQVSGGADDCRALPAYRLPLLVNLLLDHLKEALAARTLMALARS